MFHLWPGVTPLNVWGTPYDFWCLMAGQSETWLRASWGVSAGDG